ncbi:hypothetical protein [Hallella bergensis]|uniref:hypothetical protein n=1 Tax=Hallella bergensis TaxID=242750 RepID=UPI0023F3D9F0|nr:hypothetical protein [Hallella bergensis]
MSASPLDPPAPSAGIPPTDETINLVARFFDAIYQLIERRLIRGKKTFCDRYGINRWNFNTCEKTPESGMFKLSWLTYLVRDYGVSADWLLVGRGVALPPLTGDALAKYELYKKRKASRSRGSFSSSFHASGANKKAGKTDKYLHIRKHNSITY